MPCSESGRHRHAGDPGTGCEVRGHQSPTGEVDAGIVYVTDARASGAAVRAIPIPPADNTTTDYPIAVLRQSQHPTQAQEFTDFVLGPTGQRVLAEYGFAGPR